MQQYLKKYQNLDQTSQTLLQLLVFKHSTHSYRDLWELAQKLAVCNDSDLPLTQDFVRLQMIKWVRIGLVDPSTRKPVAPLFDLLIRDAMRRENYEDFAAIAEPAHLWSRRDDLLDFYMSFYRQDADKFQRYVSDLVPGCVPLLFPFEEAAFDGLSAEFQQKYFAFAIPRWIAFGKTEARPVERLAALVESDAELHTDFLPALLEWAVASGDLELLRKLVLTKRLAFRDVEGCLRLLEGDWDQAFELLSATLSNRKSKKTLTRLGGLPSLLALLSAFSPAHSLKVDKASQAASLAQRGRTPYLGTFRMIERALSFMQSPNEPSKLVLDLNLLAETPLQHCIAGYLQAWLTQEEDIESGISGLVEAGSGLRAGGCLWLAAECCGLAGRSQLATASQQLELSQELHQQLGTASLIEFVKPEPAWALTLEALTRLGGGPAASQSADASDEPTDRLVYELRYNATNFTLDVFHQVRKGSKWSKGRKIALSRLQQQYSEPAFSFLTPQDQALCQALRRWTERGSYGYPVEYCEFETKYAARALIGHPRIYTPEDREQPLEIIDSPVRLVVRDVGNEQIEIALQPSPPRGGGVGIKQTGPRQIALTMYDAPHLELQGMLGNGLQVPVSASEKVLEVMTRLTSVVTVHSEIGDLQAGKAEVGGGESATFAAAKKVEGSPRLHLHLLPSGEGLRAEFYVHPFGDAGPSCRPGEGARTLFATINGDSVSANRDLPREQEQAQSALDRCPVLATHMTDSWSVVFPTAFEALESILELETLQQADEVSLHWPKGKSLQLAGQATESMLRVQIRRDRDWFAASGELKFDRELSLDMMKLIDLVTASSGRFLRLDDGRFLALTENLRARIEDLRSFGDGRSAKGKLRFAAVHAGLFEDFGEVKVKSDTHWKKCVERMKRADDIPLEIPTTLQAELRDYQREGVHWMMRLAAWGVGGCLADDMGLGKTLQAIALLLQRASQGPAMVVAPTSVIHNWQDEITRFAPTLRPHILADSNRSKLLGSLAAGDVVLCSYGLLQARSLPIGKTEFATLILDEAQAIKNPAAKRSQAAKRLVADCRFILTGTPMENHLGELWSLLDFINPGLLGSAEGFQERFAVPIERDHDRAARQRLKRLVAPFILRRTKAQVLTELPSRTEVTLRIEPSAEESAFYEALRQRAIEKLADSADDQPKHLLVLSEIMRMRQACCHPKLVAPASTVESAKLAQTLETIGELREGNHRALIFSQFVGHLSLVREALDERKISYQYLDGSTPAAARKKSVDAFQAGEGDVFLISLKAGGTGLNLTAADYVIHLDPWWNPAVEDQASDRAHRIGQQRPVTIYRMILAGTIEEHILELHATKRDLADSLLEGSDRSSKLTTEELLKLIRG